MKVFPAQYRKGDKSEKGRILDQFVKATNYHRHYAAWLLRHQGWRVKVTPRVAVRGDIRVRWRRERHRIYEPEVAGELTKLW